MGEVIRKRNRSGRFLGWYVRYVDSDGKRKARATKATSAAEARRILVELEAAAGRRQLGVPDRPQPIRGTALIARWLAEYEPRTAHRVAWEKRQRFTLAKVMPELHVIITPTDAQRIIRKLSGLAPGTIGNVVVALKAAWRWAISMGLADTNPWTMRPPSKKKTVEYLSKDEVSALLAAADADKMANRDVLSVAVRIGVFAGLRVGEIFGLRWRDVDLDRGVLTVRQNYRGAPTKTRRERTVPLTEQLFAVLVSWRQRALSKEYVCPTLIAGKWVAAGQSPSILRLYRCANIPVPSAPWHVLRHTFASHFVMSGGSLLTLQRLLGHSTVSVTQMYSHLSDEHVASEIKKLRF